MPKFTVLMPTFNNCETLRYSIPSVLNQDLQDFEFFIIGDGCPQESKTIIHEFMKLDKRIVFFNHPKGERHGELYRHKALEQANSKYVTYLSDDDVHTPDHLSTLLPVLDAGFDFVHTLPIVIVPCDVPHEDKFINIHESENIRMYTQTGTLAVAQGMEKIKAGRNFLSPSVVAHTLQAYKQLPFGWRTTPKGIHTDLYMWQQFFSELSIKAMGINKVTHLHFAKSMRTHWNQEQRLEELRFWHTKVNDRDLLNKIQDAAMTSLATSSVLLENILASAEQEFRHQEDVLKQKISDVESQLTSALEVLSQVKRSLVWRIADTFRKNRVLKQIGHTLTKLLSA